MELSGNQLSHRKESTVGLDDQNEPRLLSGHVYPFALVLRLRVLQIVCGISSLVMGTVAFIEERGKINLGLGMPAGVLTVIAAGVSIHTSRGFGGYKEPRLGSEWRWLGPRGSVAVALGGLWAGAVALHGAVAALSAAALCTAPGQLAALALVLLILATTTLTAAAVLLHIDCRYDPD